jgi:hypothetical protein
VARKTPGWVPSLEQADRAVSKNKKIMVHQKARPVLELRPVRLPGKERGCMFTSGLGQ